MNVNLEGVAGKSPGIWPRKSASGGDVWLYPSPRVGDFWISSDYELQLGLHRKRPGCQLVTSSITRRIGNQRCRVQNCDQLVANVTEKLMLATRISRLVANRQLTFSALSTWSMFWTGAQGINFGLNKKKNSVLDFQKKLQCKKKLQGKKIKKHWLFTGERNHQM